MEYNIYFLIVLVAVVALYHLDLFSELFNLKALKPELPGEFADVFDEEKYEKSQDYTKDGTYFGVLRMTFSLLVFLGFWVFGGFGWLDEVVRSWTEPPIVRGLIYIALLIIASMVMSTPFDYYDTFVLEEKYGFNKTTLATFIKDRVIGIVLVAVLGGPLIALILWFFQSLQLAWLYAWLTMTAYTLFLLYIYPKYIFPLFNKFEPLEEGELKTEINKMAEKCQFPLTEVSVMDGSRRSTKANAFFAGFGKNKKIALFDTLVEKNSVPELVNVLAHEIGHFRLKHIVKMTSLGILQSGVMFFLISLFIQRDGESNPLAVDLAGAFGVQEAAVYTSLVFFMFLFKPIEKLFSIGMAILSRKHEFEADAYASDVTGQPQSMISALKKLSADSLSNLTPHPFYVFMHYSHPPMLERIAALGELSSAKTEE